MYLFQLLKYKASQYADRTAIVDNDCVYTWKDVFCFVCCLIQYIQDRETKYTLATFIISKINSNNILLILGLYCANIDVYIEYTEKEHEEIILSNQTNSINFLLEEFVNNVYLNCINDEPWIYQQINYIILNTTGTEGTKKKIFVRKGNYLRTAYYLMREMKVTKDDKICFINPLNHCMGILVMILAVVSGAKMCVPPNRNSQEIIDFINRYECTMLNGVPTIFLGICKCLVENEVVVSSLQKGLIGGGICSKTQFASIEQKLGMVLFPSYGMTETSSTITFCKKNESNIQKSIWLGNPIEGVEICIIDDSGEKCDRYVVGEVCVRGYNVMDKYEENNCIIEKVSDSNGWFHTGDLGFVNESGCLALCGRKKNIIIKGGQNISIDKVTRDILDYEGIDECFVFSVDDGFYGEIPVAIITLNMLFSNIAFVDFLKSKLYKYEMPAHIIISNNIPKNASGKYDLKQCKKIAKEKLMKENEYLIE